MSRHRTFRILVTKPQLYIDIVARTEDEAIERAEALWFRGHEGRFEEVFSSKHLKFEPDENACLHLDDAKNDDRSEWAETALRTFADKTGSGRDEEGVAYLIADLGHYADQNGIDFARCARRAIECWAEERRQPHSIESTPTVNRDGGES
jgi:hypothetical protein